jgi:RNA recognition motif-containing protein
MAEDSRKLFVAGLPDSITEDVLRQLFEATGGNVVEVSLPKDRATGRPRGFGFVTLSTTQEASAARESLDGSYQGGKSISVRPFQAEPPRRDGVRPVGGGVGGGPAPAGGPSGPAGAPDRTLYVGNLPYDATVEEIETLIGSTGAGPVVRVHLPMDPDGRKRGFGFVTMASAEAAKGAIDALRGVDVRGRRLVVNLAHPKGERPPREDRAPSFGGPSGGPGGYPGAGGGYSGGPPGGGGASSGGGPPPPRKTFDDRRRRGAGAGGHDGEGPPGGGGRRNNKNAWSRDRDDDWGDE